MDLHRSGWLGEFLSLILADYQPERAWARVSAGLRDDSLAVPETPRVQALRHLDLELRRSGLIYGSPKLPSRVSQGRRLARSDAHFLSVLAGECFVALDVARVLGAPFSVERTQLELSLFLAAGIGRIDLAESVARIIGRAPQRSFGGWLGSIVETIPRIGTGSGAELFAKLQREIEQALSDRVTLATGDTIFDLPVHNGRIFAEARLIGRLAVDFYAEGAFRPRYARRLLAAARRERLILLPALVTPARLQRPPSDKERRTIARELRALGARRGVARTVKLATETPAAPAEVARRIRTDTARRFLVEQAWLAAMLGGEEGGAEEAFLDGLVQEFGFGAEILPTIEAEVADYFYDPDDLIDSFEVRSKTQRASEKLVDRLEREIAENIDRIALEVKETGELAQLLGKVAVGQKLTRIEREKAREQLLDLAKVVPSLAIIAAPGGMIIFAALLKVLPFSLLPSSFQRPPPAPRVRRPTRLRAKSRRRPRS